MYNIMMDIERCLQHGFLFINSSLEISYAHRIHALVQFNNSRNDIVCAHITVLSLNDHPPVISHVQSDGVMLLVHSSCFHLLLQHFTGFMIHMYLTLF